MLFPYQHLKKTINVNLLKRSRLLAAFSVILTGNALGQLIAICAVPLLTRLYTPESFGIFASLATIIGILGPISGLTYERALPLAATQTEALILACTAGMISFCVAVVFTPIIILGSSIFLDVSNYAAWIAIGILSLCSLQILNSWTLRQKWYRRLALSRVAQNAVTVTLQLLGGVLALGTAGLIAGYVAGMLSATALFTIWAWRGARQSMRSITRLRAKATLRRFRRFPTLHAPATLVTNAGWLLPPLLLASMYDAQVAGIYFMAERITIAPTVLIGQAVGQAFYAESVDMKPDDLRRRSLIVQSALGGIGCLIAVAAIVFAEFLLIPVLGSEWGIARWAIIWMGLTIPPMLSIYPIAQFNLLERQDIHFCWASVRLALSIGTLGIPFMMGASGMVAILVFACGTVASYALMTMMWYHGIRHARRALFNRAS